MTSLSDTLTVGLVLVLLFGSIALYLYTRIQQAEQKISLLESILLDLKMSSEVKSYTELPADEHIGTSLIPTSRVGGSDYVPFSEDNETGEDSAPEQSKMSTPSPSVSGSIDDRAEALGDVSQYKSVIAEAVEEKVEISAQLTDDSKVSVNYESMPLKELQALAKTRGITGAGSMKKGAVIEALKTSDRSSAGAQPGPASTGSFLETSSSFQASGPVDESE
jgi:hypothetical protein